MRGGYRFSEKIMLKDKSSSLRLRDLRSRGRGRRGRGTRRGLTAAAQGVENPAAGGRWRRSAGRGRLARRGRLALEHGVRLALHAGEDREHQAGYEKQGREDRGPGGEHACGAA